VDGPPVDRQPSLLDENAWEARYILTRPEVQLLQRNLTPSNATGPAVDVMRVLLGQARSLSLKRRWVAPAVRAPEVLAQFRDEARRSNWRLLSVEAEGSRDVMALYRMADDKGMVLLRAGPAPPVTIARSSVRTPTPAETTEIARLEVTGDINVQQLFRPRLPREPVLAVPAPGAVPSPRPLSARPR
jgi:hypothetical protein